MNTFNSFWYVYQAGYINHLTSKKGHRGLHISWWDMEVIRDIRAAGSADLGAGARGRQLGWLGGWAEIFSCEFSGWK